MNKAELRINIRRLQNTIQLGYFNVGYINNLRVVLAGYQIRLMELGG